MEDFLKTVDLLKIDDALNNSIQDGINQFIF